MSFSVGDVVTLNKKANLYVERIVYDWYARRSSTPVEFTIVEMMPDVGRARISVHVPVIESSTGVHGWIFNRPAGQTWNIPLSHLKLQRRSNPPDRWKELEIG